MYSWRYLTLLLAFVLATVAQVGAFVVPASQVATLSAATTTTTMTKTVTVAPMMMPEASATSSSMNVAVDTVDPTNFLTDVLGGVLGTPLILAIPIVAALGVAGLVVFLIVSYANPAEDDDE